LRLKRGHLQQARSALNEAREICIPLNAKPALARIDELAQRIEASAIDYPDGLTLREVDVLRLIAADMSNREMAEELFLSVRTIERHVANIYTKIDAHNRNDAIAYAEQHGLSSS
jgi:DNA-binding NarL/FixJ family response regulator